jgi:Domain of unknown function (DUF5069)
MRARLGGFGLLPRILDKGRATLAGKNGVYNYNSPTDQYLVRFLGLDLEALLSPIQGITHLFFGAYIDKQDAAEKSAINVQLLARLR